MRTILYNELALAGFTATQRMCREVHMNVHTYVYCGGLWGAHRELLA